MVAFCRERKFCPSHFYWWKKRLRENTTARFVEVQVAESPTNLPGDSRIEVRLQNSRSLIVGRGRRHEMDPQLYFMQLLMNPPSWPANDLDAWLPDRWKPAHAARCEALEIPPLDS